MIDDIVVPNVVVPNVVVHLDTSQMNIEEIDFRQPVLAAGARLGYVHISESHRGYLGTGTVDFDTFFATLGEIGYAGTIVLESFSAAVVSAQLSTTLGIWREHWTDGMDLGPPPQGLAFRVGVLPGASVATWSLGLGGRWALRHIRASHRERRF